MRAQTIHIQIYTVNDADTESPFYYAHSILYTSLLLGFSIHSCISCLGYVYVGTNAHRSSILYATYIYIEFKGVPRFNCCNSRCSHELWIADIVTFANVNQWTIFFTVTFFLCVRRWLWFWFYIAFCCSFCSVYTEFGLLRANWMEQHNNMTSCGKIFFFSFRMLCVLATVQPINSGNLFTEENMLHSSQTSSP